MVILGDDLNDVTYPEADAGLFARDEVVFCRVVLKLSAYINLQVQNSEKKLH